MLDLHPRAVTWRNNFLPGSGLHMLHWYTQREGHNVYVGHSYASVRDWLAVNAHVELVAYFTNASRCDEYNEQIIALMEAAERESALSNFTWRFRRALQARHVRGEALPAGVSLCTSDHEDWCDDCCDSGIIVADVEEWYERAKDLYPAA